ncbi:MAG: acyltransferase, partial [Deltaproteobacteria bacterium HGW-Deltaproteobacteria-1]
MLNFLPNRLVGCIAIFLLTLNVIFWASILFVVSFLKFLLP